MVMGWCRMTCFAVKVLGITKLIASPRTADGNDVNCRLPRSTVFTRSTFFQSSDKL